MAKQTSNRTQRVADVLQRELAQLIQYEVKDPRVQAMVTISAVKVTRDLSYAKIYITLLQQDETLIKESVKALNHAAGYLRSMLARRVDLRKVPELRFVHDVSLQEGERLSQLIEKSIAKQRQTDDEDNE